MKTINYLAIIAATILLASSCVENSAKYKALVASNDSLRVSLNTVESDFNETLQILNSVDEGFRDISAQENKLAISVKDANESSTAAKKTQVAAQISQIKDILAQNKESIAQLQRKLKLSNKNNNALAETLKRMEAQVNEKSALIATLQEDLAKKNIKIDELVKSVDDLSTSVAKLDQTTKDQEATIKNMDTDKNTIWYCIATDKELKAANIVSGGGLFQAKKVMNKEFDKNAFTKDDMRNIKSIALNTRNAKVLSSHPQGSYSIDKDENKMQTLNISNPELFWSVSKYLVVKR